MHIFWPKGSWSCYGFGFKNIWFLEQVVSLDILPKGVFNCTISFVFGLFLNFNNSIKIPKKFKINEYCSNILNILLMVDINRDFELQKSKNQ